MTAKTRLQRLESAVPGVEAEYKQFRQEVRATGNRFYIDGVEVDAGKYAKEYADYLKHKPTGIEVDEIIVRLAEEANEREKPTGAT